MYRKKPYKNEMYKIQLLILIPNVATYIHEIINVPTYILHMRLYKYMDVYA